MLPPMELTIRLDGTDPPQGRVVLVGAEGQDDGRAFSGILSLLKVLEEFIEGRA